MYLLKHKDKIFEFIYGEYSRLICTNNKKDEDEVKLFRETNDSMY